jgi:transcriptional antiterminator RfaH
MSCLIRSSNVRVRQLCLDSVKSENITENWFCIRSTVGYEGRAADLLARLSAPLQGSIGSLQVFCPQIRKLMPVGGKKRTVLSALFPGYFFGRFGLAKAGRFVASRPGIIGLVRFGGEPTPVPDCVIAEMQSTDFVTAAESVLSPYNFVPGQRLLIREGPFAGMEAEYVASLNDGQRALLLLEYLHRRVNVVAKSAILESAA